MHRPDFNFEYYVVMIRRIKFSIVIKCYIIRIGSYIFLFLKEFLGISIANFFTQRYSSEAKGVTREQDPGCGNVTARRRFQ